MNSKHIATLTVAALALLACSKNETPPETASTPQSIVKQTEPPKSDGTVGMLLPDFTQLVAREGGTVVNIQATKEHSDNEDNAAETASDHSFSEFFKQIIPDLTDDDESDNDNANFGSGFIISSDGYILTNSHVVKGMDTIKVALNDKREFSAKLIGADEKSDVALLKIDASDLPVAKIGNPDELKSGEWVAAIGAPFGFENSVTSGIVSAKNRTLPDDNFMSFIQTDVAINPGNSGGPLFNLRGQIVGINSQIYSRSGGFMGISFAIPINIAMNVAEQLKTTGKVQRGQLGVMVQEVNYDLAKSFGLDKPMGAVITKIFADSPAEKGGLQIGDIIRRVNGNDVRSTNDLPLMVSSILPNQDVKLGIWRKGQMIELTIKLAAQSNNQKLAQINQTEQADSISQFEFTEAGLNLLVNSQGELVVGQASGIAQHAGLKRGDKIVEVAGNAVHSEEAFRAAIQDAGKNIALLVKRGNDVLFVALVLP